MVRKHGGTLNSHFIAGQQRLIGDLPSVTEEVELVPRFRLSLAISLAFFLQGLIKRLISAEAGYDYQLLFSSL